MLALVEENDVIEIDIPNRRIQLMVSEGELKKRRNAMVARGRKAWKPKNRDRKVSAALKAYALLTTSADKGAVRNLALLD